MAGVVLQKALSLAGVASRRGAEQLIVSGAVKVNDQVVSKLGGRVNPDKDEIRVNDKKIDNLEKKVYFLLHKPKGYISSVRDEHGRRTVLDLIGAKAKVVPVGRLDYDTSGLLILTNDGDLVYRLTHPKFAKEKEYQAKAEVPKVWSREQLLASLKKLEEGVVINDDFTTSPAKIKILEKKKNYAWLAIIIHEGRKHQVRQMLNAVSLSVMSLKRVRVDFLRLGELRPGQYRPLTADEVNRLRN